VSRSKKIFRIQSKNLFLTYPQCNLGQEKIFNYLQELIIKKNLKINYLLVNYAPHSSKPGFHSHVLIQLANNLQTTSPQFFDIKQENKNFHPHIKDKIEDTLNVKNYIQNHKDNFFIEKGIFKHHRYCRKNDEQTETEFDSIVYDRAEELAQEYQENKITRQEAITKFEEFVFNNNRHYYYNKYNLLKIIIQKNFPPLDNEEDEEYLEYMKEVLKTVRPFKSFILNESTKSIFDFLKLNLIKIQKKKNVDRSLTPILEGNSKTGKTNFILSCLIKLKIPFNYIRGDLDFSKRVFSNFASATVYDDIEPKQIFNYMRLDCHKFLIGNHTTPMTLNIKFEKKRFIKGGIFNIFICNEDKSFEKFCIKDKQTGGLKYKYFLENCKFFNIGNQKLF
jgi:hypothetical protein